MGDRGNVLVKQPYNADEKHPGVYLYTHWGGYDLPATLQRALKREQRWTDDSYLARIIFSEMVKGNEEGETGNGIALAPPDNEHPIITVDCANEKVSYGDEGHGADDGSRIWTFKGYIEASLEDIEFLPSKEEG